MKDRGERKEKGGKRYRKRGERKKNEEEKPDGKNPNDVTSIPPRVFPASKKYF